MKNTRCKKAFKEIHRCMFQVIQMKTVGGGSSKEIAQEIGSLKIQRQIILECLKPFPDNKNLTLSKLKAFADDKINVT